MTFLAFLSIPFYSWETVLNILLMKVTIVYQKTWERNLRATFAFSFLHISLIQQLLEDVTDVSSHISLEFISLSVCFSTPLMPAFLYLEPLPPNLQSLSIQSIIPRTKSVFIQGSKSLPKTHCSHKQGLWSKQKSLCAFRICSKSRAKCTSHFKITPTFFMAWSHTSTCILHVFSIANHKSCAGHVLQHLKALTHWYPHLSEILISRLILPKQTLLIQVSVSCYKSFFFVSTLDLVTTFSLSPQPLVMSYLNFSCTFLLSLNPQTCSPVYKIL